MTCPCPVLFMNCWRGATWRWNPSVFWWQRSKPVAFIRPSCCKVDPKHCTSVHPFVNCFVVTNHWGTNYFLSGVKTWRSSFLKAPFHGWKKWFFSRKTLCRLDLWYVCGRSISERFYQCVCQCYWNRTHHERRRHVGLCFLHASATSFWPFSTCAFDSARCGFHSHIVPWPASGGRFQGLFLNGFPKRWIGSLFERHWLGKPMWFLTCWGVLSPPVSVTRASLISTLGSDHLPLVVDFGIVTPRPKRSMQIETKKTTLSPVPAIVQNCSLESSNVMEALGRLETQVSKLIYLSQSDPPTQQQQQPHDRIISHVLSRYILASTFSSMLLAASIMHLGDENGNQFDAIYATCFNQPWYSGVVGIKFRDLQKSFCWGCIFWCLRRCGKPSLLHC